MIDSTYMQVLHKMTFLVMVIISPPLVFYWSWYNTVNSFWCQYPLLLKEKQLNFLILVVESFNLEINVFWFSQKWHQIHEILWWIIRSSINIWYCRIKWKIVSLVNWRQHGICIAVLSTKVKNTNNRKE